ncbi:hypothetical protein EGP98_00145 [bacterium]|nr:hypothetical protein [bacterium]
MKTNNGVNLNKFDYFPLEDYVRRINVEDFVLEHMEETNRDFDEYLTILSKCDDYTKIYYFLETLGKEFKASQEMEKHYVKNKDILENDCFFTSLQMNHANIKRLHHIATKEETDYRSSEVRVSSMVHGEEKIFWYGAKAADVKPFMDDYIKFYKTKSLSVVDSNPFLKSALAHLLFVRIHPFSDGNGRTARMIHNMKFTESINNIYGMKLKICPLNLSQSILINQYTYVNRIDDIYFDLEHDSNHEINRWFDFVLNMVDEQLYYGKEKIPRFKKLVPGIFENNHKIGEEVKKIKIK